MPALLPTLAVVAANVLGTLMVMPQAVRVLRTGHVGGVSPVWAGTGLAFNSWWLAYGIGTPILAVIPVSAISMAVYLLLATGLVRHHARALAPVVRTLGVAALVPLPALVGGGWPAVGVLLGLLYGVQLLPAVVAAWRSPDIGGISRTTWVLAWSEAALWGVVGTARADAGLSVIGVTGTLMSSLVLLATVVRVPGRRGRATPLRTRLAR
jgi:uncharacterized protein with PQ loop repeat